MVKCNSCGEEVAYGNRFYNYCPECGNEIKHKCWNCLTEIDPKKCYESPFTHYHKCPNCGVWAEDEEIEELKKNIDDSREYLIKNNWIKVFDQENYRKVVQLVMMLKASQNIRYSCPFGIATSKPQKDFYKFQQGIENDNDDFVELFNKVSKFIQEKDIGCFFTASDLNESKITNTENIVLVDYFVCLGYLQKVSLLPAKYKVISTNVNKCKYLKEATRVLYCPRCKKEYPIESPKRCDCYQYKKGKSKGLGVEMKLKYKKATCSCDEKKLNYWRKEKEVKDDNN